MPQGPRIIYLLLDEMNRSYVWQNGIMAISSSPQSLQFAPDGWKEVSVVDQRNQTTWAIDIDFTVPLNFVGDGGQILKTLYSTKGTEEKVFLAILSQRLYFQGGEYYYYYTLIYKSRVDFSTYVHDGPRVSVNMLQQDFGIMLKNNSSKTYQYALADSHLDAPILMDGIKRQETGNFEFVDNVDFKFINAGNHAVPLTFINSEGKSAGIAFQSQQFQVTPVTFSGNAFASSTQQASEDIILHIVADFAITIKKNEDNGMGALHFRIFSNKSTITTLETRNPPFTVGQTYHFHWEFDYTLKVGEQINLALDFVGLAGGREYIWQWEPGGTFKVTYKNRFKATIIKAYDIREIYGLLIKSMTGGQFVAAPSNLLSQPGLKIAITSGDGIRGLAKALVKITWNNFWSFVNYFEDPGMYVIGNQVYLERKEDCLDPSTIIDLGEVSGFKNSPANSLKFNALKIGFPNQDYGETNGKEEFNTTLEMSSPIESVSAELAFISDIRGDGYGMENIRSGLDGLDTTDDSGDGTPFALHIEERLTGYGAGLDVQTVHRLDRTLNPYATGLLFPETVFNLALSPKQCLYRKGNYLAGCLYQQEGKKLTFQNLDKNQDVAVNFPGQRPVVEKADEPIGDLGTPYFKPTQFECTGAAMEDLLIQRKLNPRALLRISLDGRVYTCIPQREGIQIATEAPQVFQLLARPDNDITLLNDYYGE